MRKRDGGIIADAAVLSDELACTTIESMCQRVLSRDALLQSLPQSKGLQKRVPEGSSLLKPLPEWLAWLSRPASPVASRAPAELPSTVLRQGLLERLWLPKPRGMRELRTMPELLTWQRSWRPPEPLCWHSGLPRRLPREPRGASPC
ncbi:MAG: hypothetical protein HYZ89_08005 [Candidatus Omnitrophica bacterium]|nr:hypothetical protein [Candidatus Omnitrophota bacterium]